MTNRKAMPIEEVADPIMSSVKLRLLRDGTLSDKTPNNPRTIGVKKNTSGCDLTVSGDFDATINKSPSPATKKMAAVSKPRTASVT
jgi:hypothetical protein